MGVAVLPAGSSGYQRPETDTTFPRSNDPRCFRGRSDHFYWQRLRRADPARAGPRNARSPSNTRRICAGLKNGSSLLSSGASQTRLMPADATQNQVEDFIYRGMGLLTGIRSVDHRAPWRADGNAVLRELPTVEETRRPTPQLAGEPRSG
jgi:hypothetical protein